MGDIAMCGYRNQDMCTNLLKRGVFHAALKYGTAPRVGTTIETALDYCREMLEPMGFCERILPSTYATWKIQSVVQCKTPKYSKFVYENPGNGVKKSLVQVDYKARQRYEMAQSLIFQVYKGSICGIWMLLIVSQLRGVWLVLSWVIHFPAVDSQGEGKRNRNRRRSDDKVEGITMFHRLFMGIVTLMRIAMLLILLYVGLSFLGRQTDYIGLLMDGVALIFIIEVQEIIYERVVRSDVRQAWEESDSLYVKRLGFDYMNRRPALADMLWLAAVAICSILFMWWYTKTIVTPLYDSLQCACVSEGEKCYEAHRFDKSFWDQYWRYDVPGVFGQIKQLKKGTWHNPGNQGVKLWRHNHGQQVMSLRLDG